MNDKFRKWLGGDIDVMENITEVALVPDASREELKRHRKRLREQIWELPGTGRVIGAERRTARIIYQVISIISCVLLIGTLLYIVGHLPLYGMENPRATEVTKRYIEDGLSETGAVNIVAGMILDYRAFDTLGESHVLFTALVCVMILLRKDSKNMKGAYEDYFTVEQDTYFMTHKDTIIRKIGFFLVPCIFIYGIYILLNGQVSPGGGFSGGAILGAGMIIFTSAYGFDKVDKYFTLKLSGYVTFAALSFYSFAKGYVFFMGANGLENHIPKGTPGAILSGGMILPLDIAVGLVVACTMYGFYSLFRRGSIGGI